MLWAEIMRPGVKGAQRYLTPFNEEGATALFSTWVQGRPAICIRREIECLDNSFGSSLMTTLPLSRYLAYSPTNDNVKAFQKHH